MKKEAHTVSYLDDMLFEVAFTLPMPIVPCIYSLRGDKYFDRLNTIQDLSLEDAPNDVAEHMLCRNPSPMQEFGEYKHSGADSDLPPFVQALINSKIPFVIDYWLSDHDYAARYYFNLNPRMGTEEMYRVTSQDPKYMLKEVKPDWDYLDKLISHIASHASLGLALADIPPYKD